MSEQGQVLDWNNSSSGIITIEDRVNELTNKLERYASFVEALEARIYRLEKEW